MQVEWFEILLSSGTEDSACTSCAPVNGRINLNAKRYDEIVG